MRELPGVFLRGLAMGAADVVPGVSGGTIAFISGIYERLIEAITSLTPATLRLLLARQWAAFWRAVDGSFLLTLLAGIFCSILTLAQLISVALDSRPHLVWGFFVGLVIASTVHLARSPKNWRPQLLPAFVVGTGLALLIVYMPTVAVADSMLWIFLAGAIAICAMVLPGISGSFLLLLLGMYAPTLDAVRNLDLAYLSLFALGCASGLLSFTHFLRWLLHHYHDATILLLTGFLAGSLPMLWPWQSSVGGVTERLLPGSYSATTGLPADTTTTLLLAVLGAALVLVITRAGKRSV